MAKVTKAVVKKTSVLADLKLSDKEIEKFTPQLSEVVDFFDQLNQIKTDVEPTSQTTGLLNVTREDEIDTNRVLSAKDATSGTEKIHNDYFLVPPTINKDQA